MIVITYKSHAFYNYDFDRCLFIKLMIWLAFLSIFISSKRASLLSFNHFWSLLPLLFPYIKFSMSNSKLLMLNKLNLFLFRCNIATNCSVFHIVKVMIEICNLSNLVLFLHFCFNHFMLDLLLDSFIKGIFQCFLRVSTERLSSISLFSLLLELTLSRLFELNKEGWEFCFFFYHVGFHIYIYP